MFRQMFELSIFFHLAAKFSPNSSGGAALVGSGQRPEMELRLVAKPDRCQEKCDFVGLKLMSGPTLNVLGRLSINLQPQTNFAAAVGTSGCLI